MKCTRYELICCEVYTRHVHPRLHVALRGRPHTPQRRILHTQVLYQAVPTGFSQLCCWVRVGGVNATWRQKRVYHLEAGESGGR